MCTTNNVAEETLFSEAAVGTRENNYQDSVIFAKGKAHERWQTLVNKGATKSDSFAHCRLNFASKISDSRAVQAEANTISVKERLIEMLDERRVTASLLMICHHQGRHTYMSQSTT